MSVPAEEATEHERRVLVVTAARELAEAEGWVGLSVRRVAERATMDVGDLYRHFADQEALLAAVAVHGFADLAAALTAAHADNPCPKRAWAVMAGAYLDFAYANPAVYETVG
ncbi:TetR/AcrR family transcriptional regulator [Micromonospora sp. DT4]|uniref:TetR/AcrR family transcriptional regulator n=1 Tax=Micromonospora sp. DT4 TaxID=3393438 RepID=UPI003CF84EAE